MIDKIKNNLNMTTTFVGLLIVVTGWVSNYTIMQERIGYIETEKNELKADVCAIEDQIKDYNVLMYKVDKIDSKINKLIERSDINIRKQSILPK